MALTQIDTDDVAVRLSPGGDGQGRSRLLDVSFTGGAQWHTVTTASEVDHSPHLLRSRMANAGFELTRTSALYRPELTGQALRQRVLELALPLV